MRFVYLDHCATTPVSTTVAAAMQHCFGSVFGNASSVHRPGQEARAALDESRARIAALLSARPGELIFGSGGTESDNHALKGTLAGSLKSGHNGIITSTAEHHAVLDTCAHLGLQGCDVTYLRVDGHGMVSPDDVRKAITPKTALISIMHANNEIGTINPIGEIATVARETGVTFHSDAAQSFGKIPLRFGDDGPDLLTISAHKIYGPKGIGALVVRRGISIEKFIHGGGQERGARAGTENVPLAVGFALAAEDAVASIPKEGERQRALRGRLKDRLEGGIPGIIVNGHPEQVLPGVLNLSIPESIAAIDAEALLFNLDLAGIAASSGSACTSGTIEPSHVLLAIGRNPATASASLRLSLGVGTTGDDVDYAADEIIAIVRRIGKTGKPAAKPCAPDPGSTPVPGPSGP